ncbi:MAG: hypothetical protein R3C18_13770 [Planctomycetaceae bacterium]
MTDEVVSLPRTFRPRFVIVAGWLTFCALFAVASYFVLYATLDAPTWVLLFFGLLIAIGTGHGLIAVQMFAAFDERGITIRYSRSKHYTWSDLKAWTQWGERGSTFVETNSGEVFGFNHWCILPDRNAELHAILSSQLGPETKGPRAVLPDWLKSLTGR